MANREEAGAGNGTLAERLTRLARLGSVAGPVVSVYLNTRWDDEHQRERTRVFVTREVRQARDAAGQELADALDWIEGQAGVVISQAAHAEAQGVALFASPDRDLRELIPVRTPFPETFVVSAAPFLSPLAAALQDTPSALVAFVDAESARLIPVSAAGPEEDVRLDTPVPGHHRRGGWAQLAQSRYQRHIDERRGRHVDAVAEALQHLVDTHGVERIVLAGSPDATAAVRRTLPPATATLITGTVPGARHEPTGQLVARALAAIQEVAARQTADAVDALLTEAAKGGRAAAGLEPVLEAVARGAVDHLYLLRSFREAGGGCPACGGLQPGPAPSCRRCGHPATPTELGESMVSRTLAAGGSLTMVGPLPALAGVDGVLARLRFAP